MVGLELDLRNDLVLGTDGELDARFAGERVDARPFFEEDLALLFDASLSRPGPFLMRDGGIKVVARW